MSFPAGLTLITVTGTIAEFPDGAAVGFLTFRSPTWLTGPADDAIVPQFTVTVPLDVDGAFTVQLPATDDPGWSPTGWAYAVTIAAAGQTLQASLQLPHDGGPVDLADVLQPIAATAGQSYLLLASRGAAGGVASLDEAGLVPLAQLAAATAAAEAAIARSLMLVDSGEEVMSRLLATTKLPLTSGTMFLTDFIARKSESIGAIHTSIESDVATGASHAWIWIYELIAGSWVKVAECADDPTRWTVAYATYDSPLLAPWSKVAGRYYAMAMLWIGSGNAPYLPASSHGAETAGRAPATASYIGGQASPPNPLNPAFTAPAGPRFQAIMLPT